jgi:hypothetical protein
MSYIGGPLPGQEKEEVDLNEKRLLGSRLSEQIQRGVAAIPRDKPWLNKVGKGLEWFADNSWHEGWIEAEEALIEQVGKHSSKIGVDPLIAQLAVGFMIPGPGEARTAKRVVSTGHLMKDALKAKGVVPKTLIDLEKINAERALKLSKGDVKRSAEATVGTALDEVKIYGAGQKIKEIHVPKELGSATGRTKIDKIPHKQIHHELMKDYYAEHVVNMRKLVREGLATEQDVIDLALIAKKHGFGMGDYKSAAAFVDKIPHDYGHEIMKQQGFQPTSTGKLESPYIGPDLGSEKSRISKLNNPKAIKKDFESAVKEIGIPMRNEINSLQDAWDRIPSSDRLKLFQLRWNRDAASKAVTTRTDPKYIKAKKQYKDFKTKLEKEMVQLQESAAEVARQKEDIRIENLIPDQF